VLKDLSDLLFHTGRDFPDKLRRR